MFMAPFPVTAKKWRQPKCPSMMEQINKLGYIHTMKPYAVVKMNEL